MLLVAAASALAACATPAASPEPAACAKPESIAKMCDVDRLAGIAEDAAPFEVGAQRTAWLSTHIDDPEAIELRVRLGVLEAEAQGKRLREVAKEAGITRCALADTLERSTTGGLVP
ncbi:MAG TPA: hypothetical protein VGM56_01320 [Byssovorax sp.]